MVDVLTVYGWCDPAAGTTRTSSSDPTGELVGE
jgi:hypothetical protein